VGGWRSDAKGVRTGCGKLAMTGVAVGERAMVAKKMMGNLELCCHTQKTQQSNSEEENGRN
jgi:hypothetical protein